jgi:hypothetical protein
MENGNKMEQFNLERALAGEPVITRDGREVTQLTKFDTIFCNPIFGVVDGRVESWFRDGSYTEDETTSFDLFMKPKENAVWVNVYKQGDGALVVGAFPFKSEAEAKEKSLGSNYLKTVKITEL